MLRKLIPLILAFSFLAAIQPAVRRAEAGEDAPPPPKGTAKAPVKAPVTVAKAQVRSNAQTPRNVVKVLRTTDKAQTNTFVPRVFEVKNANPYSVSKFVEDAVSAEGGLIATYANPETEKNSGLILVVVGSAVVLVFAPKGAPPPATKPPEPSEPEPEGEGEAS